MKTILIPKQQRTDPATMVELWERVETIFQCLALFSPFRLIYIGLGNTLMVGGAFYLMAAVIHFRTRRAFAN